LSEDIDYYLDRGIKKRDYYLNERVENSSTLILKHYKRYVYSEKRTLKLADLGCGDGRAAKKMIASLESSNINIDQLFAIDVKPTLKESDRIRVITADLNSALPIEGNTFDIVYSLETIEHLLNTDIFVKEANRILVSHGLFVLTTPNLLAWYNRILFLMGGLPIHYEISERVNKGRIIARETPPVGHIRVFSPRALKELLEDNGFDVLEIRGLKFLFEKGGFIDSFFAHFPSLSSMFSLIAEKRD
jgi:SAM-dependent methyltransferase